MTTKDAKAICESQIHFLELNRNKSLNNTDALIIMNAYLSLLEEVERLRGESEKQKEVCNLLKEYFSVMKRAEDNGHDGADIHDAEQIFKELEMLFSTPQRPDDE